MKQRLQYLAVFKNLIESDYINDYRVFNYLKKKDTCIIFICFQSTLGVLYMLKYEC